MNKEIVIREINDDIIVFTQAFSYVLLCIIKCRFPSHKSFGEIIHHRYNKKVLSKVRKLEKLLNFKVVNLTLRNSKAYKDFQLKLLRQELSNKKSKC